MEQHGAADAFLAILNTQLRGLHIAPRHIQLVAADIQQRWAALLYHWSDLPFRRTLLLTAQEEAVGYRPATAALEARAAAVLVVRNSLLEDMHARTAYTPELRGASHLSNQHMKVLMMSATRVFAGLDLDHLAQGAMTPERDPFADPPQKYPLAWGTLRSLALMPEAELHYPPLPAHIPMLTLPTGAPAHQRSNPLTMLSGLDPRLDPTLYTTLRDLAAGKADFLGTSCFKFISRNLDRLLLVLEYVLAAEKTVVTFNYYLANGYVARRRDLLPPPSFSGSWTNSAGLLPRHQEAWETLVRQYGWRRR